MVFPSGAVGANVAKNGGFEKPAIAVASQAFTPGQSFGTCGSGSAINCWLIATGTVDLVRSGWTPKSGKQSVDMNGGALAGEFAQQISVTPGTTYKIQFFMAGNPLAPDNVNVQVV